MQFWLEQALCARSAPDQRSGKGILLRSESGGKPRHTLPMVEGPSPMTVDLEAESASPMVVDLVAEDAPSASRQGTWVTKLPRKRRASREPATLRAVPRVAPLRLATRSGSALPNVEVACRPAAPQGDAGQPSGLREGAAQLAAPSQGQDPTSLARRLACGRTAEVLSRLRTLHLFALDAVEDGPRVTPGELKPRRGLQATRGNEDVFILDTFTNRQADFADVSALVAFEDDPDLFALKPVISCPFAELSRVRFEFQLDLKRGRRAVARRVPAAELSFTGVSVREAAAAALQLREPAPAARLLTEGSQVRAVIPQAAEDHARQLPGHCAYPINRNTEPHFVLDLPLPAEYDARPHRCSACQHARARAGAADAIDLLSGEEGEARAGAPRSYFPVLPSDVVSSHEGAVHLPAGKRHGDVFFTAPFLFEVLQMFYETLNVRQVRRQLVGLYAANTLAESQRLCDRGLGPYSTAWYLTACPGSEGLSALIAKGFSHFLPGRIAAMSKHQHVYNGQGLRFDGNFKLAKLLRSPRHTVVLAFCGVDGSLLQPPVIAETESWDNIEKVLRPLLRDLKAARLEAGCSLIESLPAFFSTDNYAKHRFQAQRVFADIWADMRVVVDANTPRGSARRKSVLPRGHGVPCIIAGDPLHDHINLRKLLSAKNGDANCLRADHMDMMRRLSAAEAPAELDLGGRQPGHLTRRAKVLLRSAVRDVAVKFKQKLAAARKKRVRAVRGFLSSATVRESPLWEALFGAVPPRGTLARLARLFGCELHPAVEGWAWRSRQEFKEEVGRMRAWYQPGRRTTMRKRGLQRGAVPVQCVACQRTAWAQKVQTHFRRLVKRGRLEGLWHWRLVARGLREAGVPMQTGTVSVERSWAFLLGMLCKALTGLTRDMWELVMGLAFMRHCYRHFNKKCAPAWAREDYLLAERLDSLHAITRSLRDGGCDCGLLKALSDVFAEPA